MSEPTITIEHEPATDMHPAWWWVTINGKRVVGCHSEHDAENHRDTAEEVWALSRAAERESGVEVWVVTIDGKPADNEGQYGVFTEAAKREMDRDGQGDVPDDIEVRKARLVISPERGMGGGK